MLQEVQTTPAPSLVCFVPDEAAPQTSKSPTIVGQLSPKSADHLVGEGRVPGVPQ